MMARKGYPCLDRLRDELTTSLCQRPFQPHKHPRRRNCAAIPNATNAISEWSYNSPITALPANHATP